MAAFYQVTEQSDIISLKRYVTKNLNTCEGCQNTYLSTFPHTLKVYSDYATIECDSR